MQHAYEEYNAKAQASGRSRGHFMIDLCRPGHMTNCLRNFQEAVRCTDENWDAQFGKSRKSCRTCILMYMIIYQQIASQEARY